MKLRQNHKALFFVFLIILIALTIWSASFELEGSLKEFALNYGYIGFFLIAFIGSLNIAVPFSPTVIFIIPLLSIGLSPWLLVLVGALGATLADAVGYIVGREGEEAFSKHVSRFRFWVENFTQKHPRLTPFALLFWASFVPLPNELWVIPAGIIKYGFVRTISITLVGNIIFNLLIIWFGFLSLVS